MVEKFEMISLIFADNRSLILGYVYEKNIRVIPHKSPKPLPIGISPFQGDLSLRIGIFIFPKSPYVLTDH